jgi:lipoprotein-anchoring transpeptidase ErfK/SrfK
MTAPSTQSTAPKRVHHGVIISAVAVLMVLLAAATIFCGWVFAQRMQRLYRGQIYPNVYALGVNLGGKTSEEAEAALVEVASYVQTGELVLTDGEQRWIYPWSEAGLRVDVAATIDAAYAVGRSSNWRDQLSVWLHYHEVAPRFTFEAQAARDLLTSLAEKVSQPPLDPTVRLESGAVVIVPGEPGRVLAVTETLMRLQASSGNSQRVEVPLVFETVAPKQPDTERITAQAETLLAREVSVTTYDVLTEETFTWTLDRDIIAPWLHLVPGPEGEMMVDANLYAISDTLMRMAKSMGEGRGFRFDEAAEKILQTFDAGGGSVQLYMTHPVRTYEVQAGDTLTSLSTKFGMPPGLVAEANTDIDIDRLSIGQVITIPSQDILTPYMPVLDKKIVINLDEQRMYVYEDNTPIHDWIVSTGLPDSPTHRGVFQVLNKEEEAYASQWDLWMPYFMAIYPAGGPVYNGIHELPILDNGQRLWAGNLGRPASFGCIILGIPEAETLYNWAEIGVIVEIE